MEEEDIPSGKLPTEMGGKLVSGKIQKEITELGTGALKIVTASLRPLLVSTRQRLPYQGGISRVYEIQRD